MLHSYLQYKCIQHNITQLLYNTDVYNIMLHSYLQYKCIQHIITQLFTIQMCTTYVTHLFTIQMYKTYVTQLSTITNVYNIMLHSYLQYRCIQHNVTQLSTIKMYTT